MIERHPEVPDHFLVLERRERFGDYARDHGDALARHYEAGGIIVIPHLPIDFDAELFRGLQVPPQWKKIGTANGIERPVIVRAADGFVADAAHPLVAGMGDLGLACYAQSQIASFNAQLRRGLSVLFPRYRSLEDGNITWRLRETREEGLHLDVYNHGRPTPPELTRSLRVKVFVNIDSEPRRWRTSFSLPEILRRARERLPGALPADVNVVNDLIDKLGVLDGLPAHAVAYPAGSAILVNAEIVAHEVVHGRRMVAGEFVCDARDMLAPENLSHACIASWLRGAGYGIDPDAGAVAARHAHLKGSYQRLQERAEKEGRPTG